MPTATLCIHALYSLASFFHNQRPPCSRQLALAPVVFYMISTTRDAKIPSYTWFYGIFTYAIMKAQREASKRDACLLFFLLHLPVKLMQTMLVCSGPVAPRQRGAGIELDPVHHFWLVRTSVSISSDGPLLAERCLQVWKQIFHCPSSYSRPRRFLR